MKKYEVKEYDFGNIQKGAGAEYVLEITNDLDMEIDKKDVKQALLTLYDENYSKKQIVNPVTNRSNNSFIRPQDYVPGIPDLAFENEKGKQMYMELKFGQDTPNRNQVEWVAQRDYHTKLVYIQEVESSNLPKEEIKLQYIHYPDE